LRKIDALRSRQVCEKSGLEIPSVKEFLERLFFHDIKNSLHSLSGLVQIAQYSEETDPNIPQLIDLIMEDITDQMHYHQKLTLAYQNDLSLNIEHFEISQQIKNLVGSFIELRGSRSTAIEVSHNLCSVYIESDLVLFRRIIMNMFKNAYEASQDGDSIIVSNDVYPDRLKINVWNSQPIPLPVQAQIFQQTFSTKGRGRGLGTYGIKMLSNRYLGGDVTFRSEANHGTTFTLDLPIVAAKLT
jgi:signal transduction histidine kinase